MKNLAYIAGAGLVAVGISAGVASSGVFAQDTATTEAGSTVSAAPDFHQEFIDALAKNLGLDPAIVEAAMKQTMMDMVDVRAEEMKTAIENGEMPLMPGGRGHGRGGHGNSSDGMDIEGGMIIASPGVDGEWRNGGMIGVIEIGPGAAGGEFILQLPVVQATAEFLGMIPEDLVAELQGGASLLDIATEQGKTEAELNEFLDQQFSDMINGTLIDSEPATEAEIAPEATPAGTA